MNLTRIIDIKERLAIGGVAGRLDPEERDFLIECINIAVAAQAPQMVRIDDHGNTLGRIDQIWAFLSLDDGGEGIMAAPTQHGSTSRSDSQSSTKRSDVDIYQP